MQGSLRKVLADSHVAAITIAILLFTSLDAAFLAFWYGVVLFLTNLVSQRLPESPLNLDYAYGYLFPMALASLFLMFCTVMAAWLLSRWVYGVGPLASLGSYRRKMMRKTHA